ncbi:DNA circularization protein, N-terminus [Desulfosarcina variabilis str. Montpellier]|uniref:DNA circularization protein n=1 Tax=Desulfosarcina variabilis TaxID=2300 RepID=UPI003AFA8B02
MSWKDSLLAGSFREVPFVTESTDGEIGRRTALHEFPLRDKPYAEDLGRKARRFSMTIYVIGADYMSARDALIAAFEEPGPGKLIHPYLGELTVTATEVRGPRESTREGGMARFSVTFAESGDKVFPKATADTTQAVDDDAQVTAYYTKREFSQNFDASSPGYVMDNAQSLVSRVADKIDAVRRLIPSVPEMVTDFVDDLQSLAQSAESLIRAPADLAADIYGIVADIAGLPDRIERALDAYGQLADLFSDERAVTETVSIAGVESVGLTRQARNEIAINALVRRAAVVEAVRTTAGIEYESVDDAETDRDTLADRLDAEAELAGDDACFVAICDLRAAMVTDFTARGADLARVDTYTPAATLPALVIAQTIYGDATEADAIVTRNNIAHPGFVPGGESLEVLIDD